MIPRKKTSSVGPTVIINRGSAASGATQPQLDPENLGQCGSVAAVQELNRLDRKPQQDRPLQAGEELALLQSQ